MSAVWNSLFCGLAILEDENDVWIKQSIIVFYEVFEINSHIY